MLGYFHEPRKWGARRGLPPPIPLGATHVIHPSWKMLSLLTLTMTENY